MDVVVAEALDRFSRDHEDTAGLFKRLTFAGVGIVTLAEGDITFLHIGLKGTMNAMFLKELADKTRRGLRGRAELGKAGGGVVVAARREPIAGAARRMPRRSQTSDSARVGSPWLRLRTQSPHRPATGDRLRWSGRAPRCAAPAVTARRT